ncbi:helix-turn-helix domain-containing protein [Methylovorus menthalis]|uniref:helix-turn-helix domain-containing protein n=1 Tax=Methylovorus menthalis TaxID=1002227 RepID=UPI00389913C4|nr:helix-turn-helix domain-containing protein [Methylovorus menthalis]
MADIQTSTGSLKRAHILLSAIASGSNQGSTLVEIVKSTGLPRPTIHRVIGMLITMEWIRRNKEDGRYRLGTAIAKLGYCAMNYHVTEKLIPEEYESSE